MILSLNRPTSGRPFFNNVDPHNTVPSVTGVPPATKPITGARAARGAAIRDSAHANREADEVDPPVIGDNGFKLHLKPFQPRSRAGRRLQGLATIQESPDLSQDNLVDEEDELGEEEEPLSDSSQHTFNSSQRQFHVPQRPFGAAQHPFANRPAADDSVHSETEAEMPPSQGRQSTQPRPGGLDFSSPMNPTPKQPRVDPFTRAYGSIESSRNDQPWYGFKSPAKVSSRGEGTPAQHTLFGHVFSPRRLEQVQPTPIHTVQQYASSLSAPSEQLNENEIEAMRQYDEPLQPMDQAVHQYQEPILPPTVQVVDPTPCRIPMAQTIEQLNRESQLLAEENRASRATSDQLGRQVEELEAWREDLQKKLEISNVLVEDLQENLGDAEAERERLKASVKNAMTRVKEKASTAMAQVEAARKVEAGSLKAEIAALREELSAAKQDRDTLKKDLAALTEHMTRLRGLRDECNNLIKAHATVLGDYEAAKKKNEVLSDALTMKEKEVVEWKHKCEQHDKTMHTDTQDIKATLESIRTVIAEKNDTPIEMFEQLDRKIGSLKPALKPASKDAFSDTDIKKRLLACYAKYQGMGIDVDEVIYLVDELSAYMTAKVEGEIETKREDGENNFARVKQMVEDMQMERAKSAALERERDELGATVEQHEKDSLLVKSEAIHEKDETLVSVLKEALQKEKQLNMDLSGQLAKKPHGTAVQRYEAQKMTAEDQALYDITRKDVTSAWEREKVEMSNKIHRQGKHLAEKDAKIKTLEDRQTAQDPSDHKTIEDQRATIKKLETDRDKAAVEFNKLEVDLKNEERSKIGALDQMRVFEEQFMTAQREKNDLAEKLQAATAKKPRKKSVDKTASQVSIPESTPSSSKSIIKLSSGKKTRDSSSLSEAPIASQAPRNLDTIEEDFTITATQGTKRKTSEEEDPIQDFESSQVPAASQSQVKRTKRVRVITSPVAVIPESTRCDPVGSQDSFEPIVLPRSQNKAPLRRSARGQSETPAPE